MEIDYNFLRRMSHSGNDPKVAFNRGQFAKSHGDYEGAIKDFSDAINLDLNFVEAYEEKLNCLMHLKRHEAAIQIGEKLCGMNPKNWEYHFNLGMCQFQLKNFEKSEICFSNSLSHNTNHFWSHFRRGESFFNLKKYFEAFFDYTKCIEIDPDFFGSYYNRGQIRGLVYDDAGAIEDFKTALFKKPDDALTIYNLGAAYYNFRNFEKAKKYLILAQESGIIEATHLLKEIQNNVD